MRTFLFTLLVLLAAAPAAHAVDPIEGKWFFEGGQVEIVPSGPGAFVGTVTQATTFSTCVHPVGQRMWGIQRQADGTYSGTHIRYRTSTCEEVPNSPSIWRVRTEGARTLLDFCSNDPSEGPPAGFGSNCLVLERQAAPPRRDEACAPRGGVCVDGPADLREIGCLRRGAFRHRFRVALKKRSRDRLVNRRSRVRLVRFTLDGRPNGTDRRRPFLTTVNGSTLTPGAHVLRATVHLRVPGTNRRFVRRLVYRFNGCA